jgi:serine/threonine protein kinase
MSTSQAKIHQSLPVHPNIVTLHRTLQTSSFLLLILENVPGEDLFYFLERSREHLSPVTTPVPSPSTTPTSSQILSTIPISSTPCTPSLLSSFNPSLLLSRQRLRLIASMFNQMCLAVQACHDRGVSHRDIKPENFMITERNGKVVVKLSDFGLATNEIESRDLDCGSAPYMSYGASPFVPPNLQSFAYLAHSF